jgi:hypothetical protein
LAQEVILLVPEPSRRPYVLRIYIHQKHKKRVQIIQGRQHYRQTKDFQEGPTRTNFAANSAPLKLWAPTRSDIWILEEPTHNILNKDTMAHASRKLTVSGSLKRKKNYEYGHTSSVLYDLTNLTGIRIYPLP